MNVLIVDDDRYVIASLIKGLHWESLGFTNVYTAYNIADAKKIIAETSIHLLLSDIDMPHGSGLDLLTWLREQHNDMTVIFLTNYADFGYAQKALSLKSFHYFLKPIEYDKLTNIISEATLQIYKQNTQSDKICEHFWSSYVNRELSTLTDEFELPYAANDIFLPVIFEVFSHYLTSDYTVKNHFGTLDRQFSYLKTTFEAIFADAAIPADVFLEYRVGSSRYLAIFKLPDYDIPTELFMNCERFLQTVNTQTHCVINCMIGIPSDFAAFQSHFSSLESMVLNCLDCQQEIMLLSKYKPSDNEYPALDTGILELYLNNEQYDSFLEYTKKYLKQLSMGKQLNSISMNSFQIDAAQVFYSFLKSKNILAHKLFHGNNYHILAGNARNSIYDMNLYLRYILHISQEHLTFSVSETSVAKSIQDYVDVHYAEDIGRSSLTDILYLDPDYASKLFKKEVGISFGNYIIQKRIEVAKNLLLTTNLPINTISDNVGYGNYSYFIRLFKKVTQMTPIEFRNQTGNIEH